MELFQPKEKIFYPDDIFISNNYYSKSRNDEHFCKTIIENLKKIETFYKDSASLFDLMRSKMDATYKTNSIEHFIPSDYNVDYEYTKPPMSSMSCSDNRLSNEEFNEKFLHFVDERKKFEESLAEKEMIDPLTLSSGLDEKISIEEQIKLCEEHIKERENDEQMFKEFMLDKGEKLFEQFISDEFSQIIYSNNLPNTTSDILGYDGYF